MEFIISTCEEILNMAKGNTTNENLMTHDELLIALEKEFVKAMEGTADLKEVNALNRAAKLRVAEDNKLRKEMKQQRKE